MTSALRRIADDGDRVTLSQLVAETGLDDVTVDPYRYVAVQGEVVELTQDGAADHYRELAARYTGEEDRYERRYGDEERARVILKIAPENVVRITIDG